MAAKATGAIKWLRDKRDPEGQRYCWHGRVQTRDGARPFVPLDPSIQHHEEERARACAVYTAAYYRDHGVGPDTKGETVGEWFKRFHEYQEARGLATVREMRGRIRKWVLPGIEHNEMRSLSRVDIEAIV